MYSKLRTAFNAPTVTSHSSLSRMHEHDFQFGSLMEHDQSVKQQASPHHEFDNDAVPDDFILVEVVSRERENEAERSSLFSDV